MRTVTKIVVLYPANEDQKKQLKESYESAVFQFTNKNSVTQAQLEEADIIIGNPAIAMLQKCKTTKLLQLNSAGNEAFLEEGVLPENCVLCNASGAYGLGISEYMLGVTLSLFYNLPTYHSQQKQHLWQDAGKARTIMGSKVLVVGMGNIGSEYAKRMYGLGASVIAIKRTMSEKPVYIDEIGLTKDIDAYLPYVDIIANCLPNTPATRKLFDEKKFSLMKKDAIFINVGRGTTVDTNALYDALKNGKIAKAAIDVSDPEPLPKDHPLWDLDNILITPHISGDFHVPQTLQIITEIACENLRQYQGEQTYRNQVDFKTGYRRH